MKVAHNGRLMIGAVRVEAEINLRCWMIGLNFMSKYLPGVGLHFGPVRLAIWKQYTPQR